MRNCFRNLKAYIISNKIKFNDLFNRFSVYFILLLLIIFLSLYTKNFLTFANIILIINRISIYAIIGIGMTIVVIIREIDLSVGTIAALVTVLCCYLLNMEVPIVLTIAISILVGCIWGLINGLLISRYNIHSFLVTLSTALMINGFSYLIFGSYLPWISKKEFNVIATGKLALIPLPIIYTIILYLIASYFLNRTTYGRSIYAVGGNEEAANISGIRVKAVKTGAFVASAFFASIGGVIISSKLMSGYIEIGKGWEMDIIAAVIIGGASLNKGEGKLSGTLLGMIFIGILANALNLLEISPYLQQIVKSALILIAIIANSGSKKANNFHFKK